MRGTRPLTDTELCHLLETLSSPGWGRERILVLLGVRTGLRLSSMLQLRVGDVAIAGEVQDRIRVRRGTTTGKRAGFDLPLHPQAAAALQTYLDASPDRSPGDYLFPGRHPGARLSKTGGWRAIKRAFAAAGLVGAPTEIGSHTLRKTFARLIYAALGHDLIRTSYALRHRSVATTVAYLSFRERKWIGRFWPSNLGDFSREMSRQKRGLLPNCR